MKIVICIPHSYKVFNKEFTLSLLTLLSHFHVWNGHTGMKHEINIIIQGAGWIDHMREQLAKKAIDSGAEYLLWLDTDMTFPSKMIQMMIERFEEEPELEAVTGLYTWKKPPFLPHVYTSYNKDNEKFNHGAGYPLKEPFPVVAAGFGCLMTKVELFKRIERPWFKMILEGDEIVIGEDMYFFKKAQTVQMICDPNISCRHLIESAFDISSHIQYNNIEVEDNYLNITEEQIESIVKEHKKMTKK